MGITLTFTDLNNEMALQLLAVASGNAVHVHYGNAVTSEKPKDEKPKRTRRTKAQIAADDKKAEAEKKDEPELSYADIRRLVMKLSDKHGKAKAKELFAEFNIEKKLEDELAKASYPFFAKRCQELIDAEAEEVDV